MWQSASCLSPPGSGCSSERYENHPQPITPQRSGDADLISRLRRSMTQRLLLGHAYGWLGLLAAAREFPGSAMSRRSHCPKRMINLIFCLNLGTMRRQQ
jgi:hypothetical protein